MKVLKTLLLTKTAAAAATFVWMAVPVTAHASESQGVSCPADTAGVNFTPEFSNGVLKCRKQETKRLASICSPLAFTQAGLPRLNGNITMDPRGSDTCLAVGAGRAVPSVMQPPTPGIDPPASAFTRVVSATGPDVFVATRVSYVFPIGGPVYVGDASHGVKCPAGFDAQHPSVNVLRCEAVVVKKAVCDGGFQPERRNGRDLCVMSTPLGRLEGLYTIPENAGYVGLTGNPETHGWNLDTDRSGNVDFWVKEQKDHRYPVSF